MTIAQELTNLWCCASGSRCSAQDVVVWPQSPFHSTHGSIYNASQGCAKHFCWASSERADLRHTTLQELSVNHISGWHLLCWSPGVCHSIWFVGVLDTQGLPFDGFLFISRFQICHPRTAFSFAKKLLLVSVLLYTYAFDMVLTSH